MTDFDPKTLEAAVGRVKSLRDRKVTTAREWLGDDISNSTEGKDAAAIDTILSALTLYQTTLAEAGKAQAEPIKLLEPKWMPKLSPTLKRCVMQGYIAGECKDATRRALRDRGFFYLDIYSPNGQYGIMRPTTYGKRVQATLKFLEPNNG